MDRDAEGIEFAINVPIKVPATRKPLLLILRTRFVRSGEFAIVVPATQKRLLLLLRIHYVHGGEFATACKPLILLNVSASGHAHASHLFTKLGELAFGSQSRDHSPTVALEYTGDCGGIPTS